MSCPFLNETQVRYCHASPVRKMLVAGCGDEASELCSTPEYADCRVFAQTAERGGEAGTVCPYRHETMVHYCGAAPIARFIPFSEQAGRCGGNGYRFCDLYLGLERAGDHVSAPETGGVRVPSDLFYTPNHMWLHVGPNGACHVGLDEFFAFVAGAIDQVAFVTTTGVHRPTALLTFGGVDWSVSFRNRLLITSAHVYFRSNPAPLTTDPYGTGWLFEGWEVPDVAAHTGLMSGTQAFAWMEQERARFDAMLHSATHRGSDKSADQPSVINDGGRAIHNPLQHFGREETLLMLHAFFSADRSWEEN